MIKPLEAVDLPEDEEIGIYIPEEREEEEYSDWTDEEWQKFSLHSFINTEDDKDVDWEDFFNGRMKKELNEFVDRCKKNFGDSLTSIILFGSVAREISTSRSDFDLLIVVSDTIDDKQERWRLMRDIRLDFLRKYGMKIDTIIISEQCFKENLNSFSPLFTSLVLGYRILHDKNNIESMLKDFFSKLSKTDDIILKNRGREWNLSEESLRILQ